MRFWWRGRGEVTWACGLLGGETTYNNRGVILRTESNKLARLGCEKSRKSNSFGDYFDDTRDKSAHLCGINKSVTENDTDLVL